MPLVGVCVSVVNVSEVSKLPGAHQCRHRTGERNTPARIGAVFALPGAGVWQRHSDSAWSIRSAACVTADYLADTVDAARPCRAALIRIRIVTTTRTLVALPGAADRTIWAAFVACARAANAGAA